MNQNPPRWLIIAIVIALIVFVAVAAGLALSTFRQRVEPSSRAWTPAPTLGPVTATAAVAAAASPTPATPAATATASTAPTATAAPGTATATPAVVIETPTETPSETPSVPAPVESPAATLTPTPCSIPLALELTGLYNPAASGCPTGNTAVVWAAWEPFERGALLWRQDTDTAYAFLADGRWYPLAERWGGEEPPGRGEPPAGLLAPERGFGWAWGSNDALFADLGWAIDTEKGFCAQVQPFERGYLLRSNAAASCTSDNLYNHATSAEWEPITLAAYEGGWRATRPADVVVPAGAASRPEDQGVFAAPQQAAIVLDGNPDEWPDAWVPASAIVGGAASWSGETDLSAAFQTAWGDDGLYLAVKVVDDSYRAGPPGTDLWQGDSVEINFDRNLAGDYDSAESNGDDYQIGLGFGPEMALLLGYRWLPYALEGPLDLAGAAVTTADGYTLETLIPWAVFGLTPAQVAPGMTFAFNVALNDNDSDAAAQQTVASASPARTTYDDPTQWGTLVLK